MTNRVDLPGRNKKLYGIHVNKAYKSEMRRAVSGLLVQI